jgi:hypothetical protein
LRGKGNSILRLTGKEGEGRGERGEGRGREGEEKERREWEGGGGERRREEKGERELRLFRTSKDTKTPYNNPGISGAFNFLKNIYTWSQKVRIFWERRRRGKGTEGKEGE